MNSGLILVLILMLSVSLAGGARAVHSAESADIVVDDTAIKQADVAVYPTATATPTGARPSTIKCKDSRGDDRRLCDFLLPGGDADDQELLDTFEIMTAKTDLNGDDVDEIIVWESSWSGTSGGMLWIVSLRGTTFEKRFETEMTWTPILVLPSRHKGWRDIVYHVAGGGVEPVVVTMASNGKSYTRKIRIGRNQPKGDVLIEKKWRQSLFGPVPDK